MKINVIQHIKSDSAANDTTIAVTYHPYKDDEEDATKDAPCEIHFYKVDGSRSEVERKIKVADVDILNATLQYSKQLNAMIAFADNIGVLVVSLDGQVLFRDSDLKVNGYYAVGDLLLYTTDKTMTVYQINL
jgi:hypothetical protein